MTKSPRKNVPDVGIELGAACMPSELASERATAPGVLTYKFPFLTRHLCFKRNGYQHSWTISTNDKRSCVLTWYRHKTKFPTIKPTIYLPKRQLSHLMTKPTKWSVCPAKTQISLGLYPVWSESSLCAQWVAKDPRFLHVDSEDSDQTGRMPRLIWVFAGHTAILLVLSCRS